MHLLVARPIWRKDEPQRPIGEASPDGPPLAYEYRVVSVGTGRPIVLRPDERVCGVAP